MKCCLEPLHPFASAVVIRHHRAQKSDPAIARGNDRLGHLAARAGMGNANRAVHSGAINIHDLNDRHTRPLHHRAGGIGVFKTRHNQARRPPGQHFIDHFLFAVRHIICNAYNGLQASAAQPIRDSGHHFGEDHVGQRRDDHAHKVDPLAGQRTSDTVGHIAQQAGGAQHLLAGKR